MGPSKGTENKPKRNLVRWDENLDELLLLTVQSVCNAQAIKIPWADVARTMGHNASEGAIVQHLAKIRTRRVAAGKPVPPPLRRSAAVGSCTPVMSRSSGGATARSRQASSRSKHSQQRSKGCVEEYDAKNGKYDWDASSGYEDGKRSRRPRTSKARTGAKSEPRPKLTDVDIKSETTTVEYDASSDNEDVSDEPLVPNASFLEYPKEDISPPQPKKDSKVVILKYKPQKRNAANGSRASTAVVPGIFENNPSYHAFFPNFSGLNFGPTFMGNQSTQIPITNEMGMTEDEYHGMSTAMEHAQTGPGDINTTSLDFVPLQSFLGAPNTDHQNPIYQSQPDELLGQDIMDVGDVSWLGDNSFDSVEVDYEDI